jgi:hypothetical protein
MVKVSRYMIQVHLKGGPNDTKDNLVRARLFFD